jgi:hypothetical protein
MSTGVHDQERLLSCTRYGWRNCEGYCLVAILSGRSGCTTTEHGIGRCGVALGYDSYLFALSDYIPADRATFGCFAAGYDRYTLFDFSSGSSTVNPALNRHNKPTSEHHKGTLPRVYTKLRCHTAKRTPARRTTQRYRMRPPNATSSFRPGIDIRANYKLV